MAPRIVESSDEYDELDSRGSSSDPTSGAKGSGSKKSSSKTAAAASKPARNTARPPAVAVNRVPAASSSAARPAARKAAIKANESMDVEEAVASDQDDGEDDELDGEAEAEYDEEEEEEEQDDDDAEGEDEEYGDESMQASPSGTQSPATSLADSAGPMKLKFKLGAGSSGRNLPSSPSQPPLPRNVVTLKGKGKAAAKPSPPPSKAKTKQAAVPALPKAKRKRPLDGRSCLFISPCTNL